MTDLTPLLSSLLSTHNAHTRLHPSRPTDPFLQEAYKINTHITSLHSYLLSNRSSYLSLAAPSSRPTSTRQRLTNPQRDAIDTSSKTLLRDLNASITQLNAAETFRRQIAEEKQRKRRPGALMRWARGGEEGEGEEPGEETARVWRKEVLLYLREALGRAGSVLEGMMVRRVEREVEKRRSVLYMSPGMGDAIVGGGVDVGGKGMGNGGTKRGRGVVEMEDEERKREMEGLSEEQVQMLERENGELMRQFEDQLSQVRTAQSSLNDISELQSQIILNLTLQSESIGQLEMDSLGTTENIGGGNQQLKRAAERKSTARMVFWATCGLCGFLVIWDLVF